MTKNTLTSPAPKDGSARVAGGKIANRLVALSSAAVLAVYAAGYVRTRAAALQIEVAAERRPVSPPSREVAPVREDRAATFAATTPAGPTMAIAHAPKHADTAPEKTAAPDNVTPIAPDAPTIGVAITAQETAAPATIPAATAIEPVPAPAVQQSSEPQPAAPAKAAYKDGSYLGWGTSRHGDIQALVVIEDGRITSATIAQCLTRYSCSWIAHLPGQVIARQGPEVDVVSGATQSSDAFYAAVAEALAKAKG